MQHSCSSNSGRGKKSSRAGGPGAAALFGAAATFLVLLGVAAVGDAPRELSDAAHVSPSTEAFEVAPAALPEVAADNHALSHAAGQYEDPGPQISYEVEVSV
jgi:hypothetical protein